MLYFLTQSIEELVGEFLYGKWEWGRIRIGIGWMDIEIKKTKPFGHVHTSKV
jgi:hypothetical protein